MPRHSKIPEDIRKEAAEKVLKGDLTERAAQDYIGQRTGSRPSQWSVQQSVRKYKGEIVLGAQIEQTRHIASPENEVEFAIELNRLEAACQVHEKYIGFWMELAETNAKSGEMTDKWASQLCRKEARENYVALAKCVQIMADIKKERQTIIKTMQMGNIGSQQDVYKRGYEDGMEKTKELFEQKCAACRASTPMPEAPKDVSTGEDDGDSTLQ